MAKDPNQTTASFLGLPRELRDHIYTYLLNEYHQPPEGPSQAGPRSKTSAPIYFPLTSPKPALLQLKLCSKQLHSEVTSTITRHIDQLPGEAHLDIMIRNTNIYPTWTSLPLTRDLPQEIHIALRLFESTSWGGNEFSTSAYRSLWSLFWSLVFLGPCFQHNTRGLTTPLDIGCLKFTIRLCFPTTVEDLFGTYRDVFDRLERLASDNVGLGHVGMVEARLGQDCRRWRLRKFETGLTFASRVD